MLKVTIILLTILCFFPFISFSETVEEVVDKVHENYENTKDLEATFIQESFIKTMDTIEKAEGKVYIKKPGKMRWNYKKPKKQEIIIDGKTIWIYKPDEREVLKTDFSDPESSPSGREGEGSGPKNRAPISFLAGVERLRDDFEIRVYNPPLVKGGERGIFTLELIPKGIKGNIEKIFLEVEPTNYKIQRFSLIDIYGNKTTIILKNIKINQGLRDSIFHFKVPQGIKVIEQ